MLSAAWQAAANRHIWNEAVWIHTTNVQTWVTNTEARLQAERQAAIEAQQRSEPSPDPSYDSGGGSGRCGGNLPPCSVMECESGGDPTAQNPNSSASGKWQVIDSTWNNYGGYPSAASAPESVQDAFAAQLYAGGAGRGHWSC